MNQKLNLKFFCVIIYLFCFIFIPLKSMEIGTSATRKITKNNKEYLCCW